MKATGERRAGYKEIARLSGVSIGTVYRVLHDRGRYSPETAARVRGVANELGYKKNIYASNLSRSREVRIAVVMPDPSHDNRYWAQPHAGIVDAIGALEHYRVHRDDYFYDEHARGAFGRRLATAARAEPDALIIAPAYGPGAAEDRRLDDLSIPHVLIDAFVPSPGRVGSVGQRSYSSGRAAGDLLNVLVPAGERVITARSLPASRHLDERIRGAADRLREAGREPPHEVDLDFADPAGALATLRGDPLARAAAGYFVSNSNASILVALLDELGIDSVPIVGYDLVEDNVRALRDGRIAFLLSQRRREQARIAVEMIYRSVILGEPAVGDRTVPIDIVSAETVDSHLPPESLDE